MLISFVAVSLTRYLRSSDSSSLVFMYSLTTSIISKATILYLRPLSPKHFFRHEIRRNPYSNSKHCVPRWWLFRITYLRHYPWNHMIIPYILLCFSAFWHANWRKMDMSYLSCNSKQIIKIWIIRFSIGGGFYTKKKGERLVMRKSLIWERSLLPWHILWF